MTADPDELAREHQLDEILTAYLKALDDGRAPDRAELLARYPHLAAEMAEFFAEQDRLNRWTEPLRPVAQAARLDTPAAGADTLDERTGPAPGTPVGSFGDYELLRVLGHGGMGVVYEARHRPLNRVVALKMIPAGRWAPETDVRRFRNEAEAVAHLDHPNIVPIYDVGEHDGQPYFAMKLIEGGSLAQKSEVRDQRSEVNKEAARSVATVARAVHHAHQRGILHRDLKPSNVLLDADGRPYVTDFGLAKRLQKPDDAGLTQSGALVGTPGYVAPEQATGSKGAATVASDVYGLGAILYALLTGGPPFRGDDILDTLALVCHREPEPPRKSNPRVGRDLELICLKCLEKDPRRRYPSAEALAEELERYLDGRPLACTRPVGGAERLWRWYRRNVVLASLGAAVALSVLAVAVVSVVAYFRLDASYEQERRSRAEAEAHRTLAVDLVNRFFKKVSENKGSRAHGLEPFRKELLTDAKELYERLARMKGGDPAVEAQRGLAYWGLAQITEELGDPDEAIRLCRQARTIFERLTGAHPQVADYQVGLADTLHSLGTLYQETHQFADAEKIYGAAVPLREQLAADHPGRPAHEDGLARTLHQQARLYQLTGQPAKAKEILEKALPLFDGLARRDPRDPGIQDRLARTYQNLGTLHLNAKPPEVAAAETNYDKALPLREGLVRDYPGVPDFEDQLAETLHTRGTLYRNSARPDKALGEYDRALPYRRRLVREHQHVPGYRNELASLLHARGVLFQMLTRWDEAKTAFAEAVPLREELARDPRARPFYKIELGKLYYDVACLYSLTSAEALKDAGLPPSRRGELAEEQAAHAVGWLRKARQVGCFDDPTMAHLLRRYDADLAPIRARDDFRELLNELDKETAGRKKLNR